MEIEIKVRNLPIIVEYCICNGEIDLYNSKFYRVQLSYNGRHVQGQELGDEWLDAVTDAEWDDIRHECETDFKVETGDFLFGVQREGF